jgi:hypothetical protein
MSPPARYAWLPVPGPCSILCRAARLISSPTHTHYRVRPPNLSQPDQPALMGYVLSAVTRVLEQPMTSGWPRRRRSLQDPF